MKVLRRIGIALAGGTILLVGIAMIVLPGPAIVVIPAGLAILALEFAWARYCLRKMRHYIAGKKAMLSSRGPSSSPPISPSKVPRE